ncbi:LPXTG cell wall anchor domain-containing protein [Erwinia sp. CPCC 100877]|nr:LPXTG cell wall anchor domain-containing protein [Erwinia sp. CPCC 100877]
MKKISVFLIILGFSSSIFSWSIASAEAEDTASQSVSSDDSLKQSRAVAQTGKLVFNIKDSDTDAGIGGAYFSVTSKSNPQDITLMKTDETGQANFDFPVGEYLIKQIGTTDKKENYTFTSIGFGQLIESGKTVDLVGYERKLPGEYAFGNSPDVVHVPLNSTFDSSVKTQGIQAYRINSDGTLGTLIPNGQTYVYYNNVDTSVPGEYIAIYMARQTLFNANTTHILKVIVDPAAPVAGADLTIRYVDQEGNQIHDPATLKGMIGAAYNTAADGHRLAINGYTLDETKLPANEQGFFTDQEQTITYIYTKAPIEVENVKVQYLDQTGEVIHEPQVLKGIIGDTYNAAADGHRLAINGYTLDETKLPANEQGVFTDQAQIITYVYTKNDASTQHVIIYYVDQTGRKIHEPQVINGALGSPYNTAADHYRLNIEGYSLDETKLPTNERGVFMEQDQIVVYVYSKLLPKAATENLSSNHKVAQAQHVNDSVSEKRLPQTGEKNVFLPSIVGAFLLAVSTFFVLDRNRKK